MNEEKQLSIIGILMLGFLALISLSGSFLVAEKIIGILNLPTNWGLILALVIWALFVLTCKSFTDDFQKQVDDLQKKHGYDVGRWHALGDEDIENMDENGKDLTTKVIKNRKKKNE